MASYFTMSIVSVLGLLLLLALLSMPAFVWASGAGISSGANLTPQNDRVAVFTDSWGTVYYCEFLGIILGRDIFRKVQSGDSADAILWSSFFSMAGNEYGIIITNYGSTDAHRDYPWEEIEPRMKDLFRRLKATGAIVVYNQIAPESHYHFGEVCEEEGVIRVEENYWLEHIFDYEAEFFFPVPWGRTHPGPWGAAVMAERTARVMLDAGIVEWVEPCEMDTLDFEGLYSNASQLIEDVEQLDLASEEVDVDLEGIVQYLALAEPLYDVGACFTTRWLLRDWIMEPLNFAVEHWDDIQELFRLWENDFDYRPEKWPLAPWTPDNLEGFPLHPPDDLSVDPLASRLTFALEHWDEVMEMFSNASAVMDAAEELGVDTNYQRMCYDMAKIKWRDLDYDGVDDLLVRIHTDLEPLISASRSDMISGLTSQADGMIEDLEDKGFDCQKVRGDLALLEASWLGGDCSFDAAKEALEEIIDRLDIFLPHADEVRQMLSQADECIEAFRQAGDTGNVTLLEADYASAVDACAALDYEAACIPLNSMMERCPERMLLPILGLLLLPMFKRPLHAYSG